MASIKISPSILSADFSKLGKVIQDLEKANADLIHIDVMDGHFVPNITIGPEVINKLRKYTSLPFDVHLMISPVDHFIKNFAEAGADIITIHPEATNDLVNSIKKIKSFNLDKIPELSGILTGIKGQYIIIDNEIVLNIRKYTGCVSLFGNVGNVHVSI